MKKVFSFLAIAAMICMVSCKKTSTNNNEKPIDDPIDDPIEEVAAIDITIDGQFEDWAALKPEYVSVAKNNPNSPWEGVSEIRCCATPDFVYYYIKFNSASLKECLEEMDTPEMHIRLNINTDGEFTSGYANYSLDAYDFIVEGQIAAEGAFVDFAGTLHQRFDSWQELIPSTGGLVAGKGAGTEYEILFARELFNNAVTAEHQMGDIFHTGIRFYCNGWDEFSNMPNASVDDGDGNGWGHLMEVATVK